MGYTGTTSRQFFHILVCSRHLPISGEYVFLSYGVRKPDARLDRNATFGRKASYYKDLGANAVRLSAWRVHRNGLPVVKVRD